MVRASLLFVSPIGPRWCKPDIQAIAPEHSPPADSPYQTPPLYLSRRASTLRPDAWRDALALHPDRKFADYVTQGISEGFRVCFDYSFAQGLRSRPNNMGSASDNPEVVDSYIDDEVTKGRLIAIRPEDIGSIPAQVSPFGVIPKKSQPGKWRLIVDLSSPHNSSVNDGIAPAICSMSYPSVHDAARIAHSLGSGALLAKIDLQSAYRAIPVHPQDRWLLAVRWRGQLYLDSALPFGLRSAPKIFSAVADALEWVMHQHGISNSLHYLDNYLFLGSPGTEECADALRTALDVCSMLGFPVAIHKIEGPSPVLSFLGIEIDTVAWQLRLPEVKLSAIRNVLRSWAGRRRCTKRDLQSLLGLLNHAASVVGPGQTFLRGIIDALPHAVAQHHHVRLNAGARADILWWSMFIERWNGISVIPSPAPSVIFSSDASGSWGCGAAWGPLWFQIQWPPHWAGENIATKELVPIVAATVLWGQRWRGQSVRCQCDNMAVVAAINSGRAKFPPLNRLLRCMYFFCAHFNISVSAEHIEGRNNALADAISRNLPLCSFPQLSHSPAQVPSPLANLLLDTSLLWSSPAWRGLFSACLRMV